LSQSEGNGRCKVPSACGSSIAVNKLIYETYFDMIKKKEKNESVQLLSAAVTGNGSLVTSAWLGERKVSKGFTRRRGDGGVEEAKILNLEC
jgi:hypothetical protein